MTERSGGMAIPSTSLLGAPPCAETASGKHHFEKYGQGVRMCALCGTTEHATWDEQTQQRVWVDAAPNASGESRAIARTLDPIVGNLDSGDA